MEQKYLGMLPAELRLAVEEAEHKAGCAIKVMPNRNASDLDNIELAIDRDGRCDATILFRGAEMSRSALIHEVLHIRRYWNLQIPSLFSRNQRFSGEAQQLDDFLEHLIIIPEERAYVETSPHWEALLEASVSSVPDPGPFAWPYMRVAVLRVLFRARALYDIALPGFAHVEVIRRLEAENLMQQCEEFLTEIRRGLNSKIQLVATATNAFYFESADFWLRRFNLDANPKRLESWIYAS